MAENTKIQWCDHTFNPWRGCTKVSAGCANCYAESMSAINPKTLGVWGPQGTRVVASESMWREPLKWNKAAEWYCPECASPCFELAGQCRGCGSPCRRPVGAERPRVFCASLADVFEDWEGPMVDSQGRVLEERQPGDDPLYSKARPLTMQDVRLRLFALIDATPHLDWLLLTKRPENVLDMWDYHDGSSEPYFPTNVWLGTSVENQATKHRIDELRKMPAKVRFLSCEPLLEDLGTLDLTGVHWVIVGGESGTDARPCNIDWIRSAVRQCQAVNVPVFVKQVGSRPIGGTAGEWTNVGAELALRGGVTLKDPKGGDPAEWPTDLRVRELPHDQAESQA